MFDLFHGLIDLPWWGLVLVSLGLTHITIVSVTLFLHRAQAHRSLNLHPAVAHFFRFWLWLTTSMKTKEWVSVHRKHHAKCETAEDPHSPQFKGIRTVLWQGAELYGQEADNRETLENYGHGTPDDWLERNLYSRYGRYGVGALLVIYFILFGIPGITLWGVQMLWIPFFAAGVINGIGHYWGYRNFEVADGSTNIVNLGLLIGGEELHNNHHAFPSSARFSNKWWEVDVGWMYIRLLVLLRLAEVKKVAPRPKVIDKATIDLDTVRAVVAAHVHVMAQYAKNVTLPVFRHELARADVPYRRTLKQIKPALVRDESRVDANIQDRLMQTLKQNEALTTVYEFRRRLQDIWARTSATQEKRLAALQEWCHQAEATGIQVLKDFAARLRGYTLSSAG